METLRRLRGLLGVGTTWGVLWAGVGALIGLISPGTWADSATVLDWTLGMGLYGLVSGIGFGGLLSLGEGRRTLRELSLGRVAVWGLLGGAFVPVLFAAAGLLGGAVTFADIFEAVLLTGFLGGTFAPGAVAVARRAELAEAEERPLLGDGEGFHPPPG